MNLHTSVPPRHPSLIPSYVASPPPRSGSLRSGRFFYAENLSGHPPPIWEPCEHYALNGRCVPPTEQSACSPLVGGNRPTVPREGGLPIARHGRVEVHVHLRKRNPDASLVEHRLDVFR